MKEEETELKPLEQAHLVSLTAPQNRSLGEDPLPDQGKPPTCPNIRCRSPTSISGFNHESQPQLVSIRDCFVSQAVAYALSFLCSAWHFFLTSTTNSSSTGSLLLQHQFIAL